jgi:pimeloyl-ACP methyl ester carboxylesterase
LGLTVALLTPHWLWAADVKIQSSNFDSAGVKIVYFEGGLGSPVILIHGLYSSATMNWIMPGIFQMLAQNHHVIALDLRGHGASDKPQDDASYGQPMVDDVTRLMDHLNIQKAQIVGYSLGGIIVGKFMVDHPERVIAGSLGGMGWLRDGSFEQRVFEGLNGQKTSSTPPACVHGIARLAITEQQIKSINVPVEIEVGDHDPCRRMYVDPLRAVRLDWPVVVIENAGHISCVTKEQYKDELKTWVEKNTK